MPESVHLCLSDLLDQDLSSQEYFNALPNDIRRALLQYDDIRTFHELQDKAGQMQKRDRNGM